MGLIDQLKLSDTRRITHMSPIQRLRHRVAEAIDRQIAAALHDGGPGSEYKRYDVKTVQNPETGETETIKTRRRFVKWYWEDQDCNLHVALRYGHTPIVLKGNRSTIDVADYNDLVETLKKLHASVLNGDLDAQIQKASDQRKQMLKKRKPTGRQP